MTCHTTVVPAPNRKGCVIKLSGTIDEHFDGKAMVEAACGVVVLDLKQVTRITSFGVQKWIDALRLVVPRSEYVGIIECGPAFVTQLNTVMGFSAGAQVISFYVPLRCLSCDTETQKLIDLRVDHAWVRKLSLPEIRCTACGATSVIDDDPASYLAFVAGAPLPRPPALFDRLLKGELSVSPGLLVRKDVRNNVTGIWLKGALEPSPRFRRLGEGLEGEVVLVCRELESATVEGIEQLVTFLKTSPTSTQLAQVPLCVAAALRANPGHLTLPGVCSAWLPFRCNNCDEVTSLESDLGQLNALFEGRAEIPPCQCGGVLKEAFSSVELRQVRGLHLVAPTTEVAHYLRDGASDFQGRDGEPFGRYQVVKSLGTSGSVEMLLARQTGIGGFTKHLVLKRLLPQYSQDRAAVDAFLEGARRGARISHPNVLQLTDFGEIDRRYYYALEHIRGWTLEDLLQACEKLNVSIPAELSALIVREVCNGLHAAHSHRSDAGEAEPITHGDVFPRHILISAGGHVKLTDFGKPHATRSTPNQVAVDVQSDIFSVGIILGQLLCAPSPLTFEETEIETRSSNQSGVYRAPWEGRAAPELGRIAARAAHYDINKRYMTALSLRTELEAFLHQQGPTELGDWVKELIERSETMGGAGELGAEGADTLAPTRPRWREEVALPKSAKLRVLFIAGGSTALEEGTALLRTHFEDVDPQAHLENLQGAPEHDLAVIDYDSLDREKHAKIIESASNFRASLPLIFISDGACKKDFTELFETRTLTHLIGRNKTFDLTQLLITARKLLSKDIFGIEPYLAKGAQVKSWVISRASQKNEVISQTEEFLKKHAAPSRVSAAFLLVMDELFTNAVFNAPIDSEGKHRFRTLSRSEEVTLEPGEEVEVKLCHDGQRIGISVADPFGALSRRQLYEYLSRGLKKGEDQMSTSGGGAGLGLYLLFQSLNHLVVNSYPTRRTEILGFMPLANSYRSATELNKSFDYFTTARFSHRDGES